ncbi:MAG TPA: class I SAM-dependent methyltransferase [Thermoanaerobaculia bacterium]|nr:class I SAM-dependent methyltransferase [Thermoanaerobaculia bacterium]
MFRENGREFLHHYVERCGLEPHESVLDVGSGMGRKTVPLTRYLSPCARYLGLDVNLRGVQWCRSRISSRFPNFEFGHLDVFNGRYNPRGALQSETVTFPCPSGSVDFVVMASVFTHMLPGGVERYLRETARVLRPDTGRCLITFFLLDAESVAGIAAGTSAFGFAHRRGEWAIEDPDRPEEAVAYHASWVGRRFDEAGLTIAEVFPGSWSGRSPAVSFQDLVLARCAR